VTVDTQAPSNQIGFVQWIIQYARKCQRQPAIPASFRFPFGEKRAEERRENTDYTNALAEAYYFRINIPSILD